MGTQAMTKEEVIARLNQLDGEDTKALHQEAESLLTDALMIAKMSDVVEAYLEAKFRLKFSY